MYIHIYMYINTYVYILNTYVHTYMYNISTYITFTCIYICIFQIYLAYTYMLDMYAE